MIEWIEKRTKSAYLKLLESEIVRLRDENRQLVNSLLALNHLPGIGPMPTGKTFQPLRRANWFSFKAKKEQQAAHPVAPVQPELGKPTDG